MNIPHAFFISLIEPYFILHRKLQKLSQKLSIKQAECQNLTAHSKGSKTLHTDNRKMKHRSPLLPVQTIQWVSGPISGLKVSSKDRVYLMQDIGYWMQDTKKIDK